MADSSYGVVTLSSGKNFPFNNPFNFVGTRIHIAVIWVFQCPYVFAESSSLITSSFLFVFEVRVVAIFPLLPGWFRQPSVCLLSKINGISKNIQDLDCSTIDHIWSQAETTKRATFILQIFLGAITSLNWCRIFWWGWGFQFLSLIFVLTICVNVLN